MVGIVLIAGAVKQAWDEDGVLVLMDLGSAVLSAEMAAEMLPDEQRSRVLLCEAPLVEGAVAAAVAARLGQPLAADSLAVPLLLGLGVRELSVSAAAVGKVKQAVRATDLNVARELARQAIRLPSAGAVRELMSRHGTPLPAR